MSKTLNEIREEIDAIDTNVHDLLMRRAELVNSVASAKKKEGLQIVQPAREAAMIRRLLTRHSGPLPKTTIIGIWRELVGAVALLQTGLSVCVAGQENDPTAWELAKQYFGSAVPMKRVGNAAEAINSVLEDETSFAVMPWPEQGDENPWWGNLFSHKDLSIITALPYGAENIELASRKVLILSKIKFMDSGNDISIIGLELKGDIRRDKIKEELETLGFEVLDIYSAILGVQGQNRIHLVELVGFIRDSESQLKKISKLFGDNYYNSVMIGGYPAMPEIYEDAS
ncbi:MAG: chorismate mutase [Alphaproteobacteria bacterium]|nr:chorismate mutase [Alphaproteobacteria bacterium]